MPRKIPGVTRQDLVNAILPPATKTYTVISHNFVITNVLQMLSANGFEVKEEVYRCTKDAQVASGIYRINYEDDHDLGMMFAFGNSYDKSMRFKCAVGAYIYANQSSMINKMSDWNRKHTGTADAETQETIESQVNNAMVYYNELREQKNLMKDIEADPLVFGKLLGELYFNLKLLTGEQMAIIKREYEKPSFAYTTGKNNLWTLYNHILVALKISHPRTWMEQQTAINYKIAMDFNLIEFDEDETADEKVSNVSSAGKGNAGMFLPGFGKTQNNEFNPDNNEIKPIHEILELDAAAEDAFANEPVIGHVAEVTAEEVIEEYGQEISEVDSITIKSDMTADEALETYPEMTKEIAEAVGVEVEVQQESDIEYQERVVAIESEEEEIDEEEAAKVRQTNREVEPELAPESDIQSRINLANEEDAQEEFEQAKDQEVNEAEEEVEVKDIQFVPIDGPLEVVTDESKPLADGHTLVSLENYPEAELEEIIQLGESTFMVMDFREENGVKLMELNEVSFKEDAVEIEEEEIPWVTDEEEDEIMEQMFTEIPQEESPTFDNTTVDDQEELEKDILVEDNIESTNEVFDIEEEEVVPGIEPVVGLDEPVQIMSPAEAKDESELIDTPDKTSDLYITIKLELLDLYGYSPEFTYTEKDSQYNVVLESGETVVLSAAYIDSLDN